VLLTRSGKHIEELHAEGKSPFVINQYDRAAHSGESTDDAEAEADDDDQEEQLFAECPIDGCGEVVALAELDDHAELHVAEESGANTPPMDCVADGDAVLHERHGLSGGKASTINQSQRRGARSLDNRQAESRAKWSQILDMRGSNKDLGPQAPPDSRSRHARLGVSCRHQREPKPTR
jgi:zinc finger-containing ubiquitin peptidase 1